MRTRKTHLLLSLAALTLAAQQPACAIDATSGDGSMDDAAEAPEPSAARDQLVSLTPIAAGGATMLGALAGEMQVVEARPLLEALGAGEAEPAEILARAGAIVADLEQIDGEVIDAYQPLIDAAGAAGVPLVLENIREPSRMAAMIGFGLAADGAVVEPSNAGRSYTITLLGEAGELTVAEDDAEGSPATAAAQDPKELAEKVAARLRDLAAAPMKPRALTTYNYPVGTYRDFVIFGSPVVWDPNGHDQNATIDMGVQVQLVASSQPNAKFMVISGVGSGATPGSLTWNNSGDRGYFQESVTVGIQPDTSAPLISYAHQPGSTNASGTFSRSNGCSFGGSVGLDGASTSFSCSIDTTTSISLTDFGVVDQSSGTTAKWSFRMMEADGAPYDDWEDLIDDCDVRSLPTLATSTMDPDYEVVYRADQSYAGTASLTLQVQQLLRDTWLDDHFFWCDTYSKSFTATVTRSGAADFSKVSLTDVWTPLVVKSSGLAVDVDTGSTSPLASIIQWTYHGQDNQLFQLVGTPDGDGYSFIKARHSGLCLDVEGASLATNTKLIQHGCHGGDNQRFKRIDAGNGYFYLKVKHSDLCIGPHSGSSQLGYQIVQAPCTGSDAQLFRFTP